VCFRDGEYAEPNTHVPDEMEKKRGIIKRELAEGKRK